MNWPFAYFYEPGNLYRLAVHLNLQSSSLIWSPHEKRMAIMRVFMVKMGELMVQFKFWVEARTENA